MYFYSPISMNKMILLVALIGIGILGATPVDGQVTFPNPLTSTSISEVVDKISDWLFNLAIVAAPVLLVIGGIIFMTAAGDPGRLSTAKRMILWTVVGFLVILLSQGLISVVVGLLG